MTLADRISLSRVVLAPVFFIVYMLPVWFPTVFAGSAIWVVPVLWIIYVGSEVSDALDGWIARKRNEVSNFGKLLDPFSDTLMQLTVFLCFVLDGGQNGKGLFPAMLYLLVVYREFGILFIRNMMLQKGISMGARMSGKVKTVMYILAGGAALITVSLQRLAVLEFLHPFWRIFTLVLFCLSVAVSVFSFFEYLIVYLREDSK